MIAFNNLVARLHINNGIAEKEITRIILSQKLKPKQGLKYMRYI